MILLLLRVMLMPLRLKVASVAAATCFCASPPFAAPLPLVAGSKLKFDIEPVVEVACTRI